MMEGRFISILAIAGIAIGCAKVESHIDSTDVMRFEAAYPSTRATETGFEAGDTIGVYISGYEDGKPVPLQLGGNYKNNNPVIFDGHNWTADPVIYWEEGFYDIFAYYPFLRPESVDKLDFSVQANQNDEGDGKAPAGYEASDFLYATAKGLTKDDGAVRLAFSHLMSCLRINLVKGEDFKGDIPDDVTVYVHNTVTRAVIDLSSGDVVKNPRASAGSIIARRDNAASYSAIIVPQMIESKMPLIEIVCCGVSYLIESRFTFKTGVRHTFNVTMSGNPDKIKIEIGGELDEGWN